MKLYIPKAATKPEPKYFVRLVEAKNTTYYSGLASMDNGYVLLIVDEDGVEQVGGYLLTISQKGVNRVDDVNSELAKLAGIKLNENGQIIVGEEQF